MSLDFSGKLASQFRLFHFAIMIGESKFALFVAEPDLTRTFGEVQGDFFIHFDSAIGWRNDFDADFGCIGKGCFVVMLFQKGVGRPHDVGNFDPIDCFDGTL